MLPALAALSQNPDLINMHLHSAVAPLLSEHVTVEILSFAPGFENVGEGKSACTLH